MEQYSPLRNQLQQDIHRCAKEKGWWDEERGFPEIIALMHSELSEALESYRNNQPPHFKMPMNSLHPGKSEGYMVELADCIIRIMDYAEHEGFDILKLAEIKMKYNWTRPHRHGGKRA